jgi:hypothetical protein
MLRKRILHGIILVQFRANRSEDPVTGMITHTMYMSVHIFNTHYVHFVPAFTGTHFQLGGLKQLGVKHLAQGLNMMAPGEVRTHDLAVTRRTL